MGHISAQGLALPMLCNGPRHGLWVKSGASSLTALCPAVLVTALATPTYMPKVHIIGPNTPALAHEESAGSILQTILACIDPNLLCLNAFSLQPPFEPSNLRAALPAMRSQWPP